MVVENNQVIKTIEAMVEYKEAKREVKEIETWWLGVMLLSVLVTMLLALTIVVVFNDWAIANIDWFVTVMKYITVSIILLMSGVGLWKMKQKEKDIPDYEKNPSIDKSLFLKLSILNKDSFLYTANELLKESGSDKHIIQMESNEMLLF